MEKALIAATHIGVKLNQDRSSDDHDRLILCDGVGEFPDSGLAAESVIQHLESMDRFTRTELVGWIGRAIEQLERDKVNGGTTLLLADLTEFDTNNKVHLAYIGNGAIYHFRSDLTALGSSFDSHWLPYRYTNLMLPHVEKDTALTSYIGPGVEEHHSAPTILTLQLSGEAGNALMLVTDGISSLEDEFIMRDDANRLWQLRSSLAQRVMIAFIDWIKSSSEIPNQEQIREFLQVQLSDMKKEGLLEDDAAIGLVITNVFLNKLLRVS